MEYFSMLQSYKRIQNELKKCFWFQFMQRQNDSDESQLCYGCQHFLNDAVSFIIMKQKCNDYGVGTNPMIKSPTSLFAAS